MAIKDLSKQKMRLRRNSIEIPHPAQRAAEPAGDAGARLH